MRVAAGTKPVDYLALAILAAAPLSLLGYGGRDSFPHFLGWIVPALLAWGWLVWQRGRLGEWPAWVFWVVFLVVRAPWFATLPILSDDFYRFIWDGHSWIRGVHAYAFQPESHPLVSEMPFRALFPLLNSPRYFTIYPGPSQACFALSTALGGTDLLHSVTVLRLCWLLFEILGLWVLRRLVSEGCTGKGTDWVWMLFPVLIQEGIGNLHSELPALTGLALLVLGMFRKSSFTQFLGLTIAVQFKLMPLFLLGLAFGHEPWARRWKWMTGALMANSLLLAVLFGKWEYFQHFTDSIRLYTETFRFNSGLYELFLFATGMGTDISGRIFQLISFGVVAGITIHLNRIGDPMPLGGMAAILALYWLGSPVIHPWYLLLPVFMQLFTRQKWAWVWLILSLLTYLTYTVTPYQEQTWVMVVEYLGLGIAFFSAILAPGWKGP